MDTVEITIRVAPNIAAVYNSASPERQKEIGNLIGFLLMKSTAEQRAKAVDALEQTAKQANREAQAKGLTPDILEEILNED